MNKDKTLGCFLESFFNKYLRMQRRASESTIAAYRDALLLLMRFVADSKGKTPSRLSLTDFTREQTLAFLDYLEKERGNSCRTRNARLAAIRSFMNHAALIEPDKMGLAQRINSIPFKRHDRKTVTYLQEDEIDAILGVPDQSLPSGRRDYAMLLFLLRTGARVSEAIGINAADIRMDKPACVILRGKGGKERAVPLADDLRASIKALLRERRISESGNAPLFVNAQKQRITRFGVSHVLQKIVREAVKTRPELMKKRVSPHIMRHTLAMQLLQAGVDLTTIKSWLGHVSLDTTHLYMEADIEMKRKALDKCGLPQGEEKSLPLTDEIITRLMAL